MKKFAALLYREMRLARKMNIWSLITMIGYTVMVWLSVLWVKSSPDAKDLTMLPTMTIIPFLILPFIGGIGGISYYGFKRDITVKWLDFSYTLPVSPNLRAVVSMAKKLIGLFSGLLIAVINAPFLCKTAGVKFGANLFSIGFLVICLSFAFAIVCDFFSLPSRTVEDLNKNNFKMTVCLAVLVVTIGAIMKNVLKIDGSIDYTAIKGEWLVWIIPLMLALTATDYFIVRHAFKSAYPGKTVVKVKHAVKEKSEPLSRCILSGFHYKEFTQNKGSLLILILVPFAASLFPFIAGIVDTLRGETTVTEMLDECTSTPYIMLMFVLQIMCASMIITGFWNGDDKKQHSYFVVSTPRGIRSYMYSKYVLTAVAAGLYMVSYIAANELLATVYYFVSGKEMTALGSLPIMLFFALLFMAMTDIPLTVRFGAKRGSYIKTTAMLVIATLAVTVFEKLPDSFKYKLVEGFVHIYQNNPDLIISVFCLITLAGFYGSYRLSCKLFLKGAEANG